jgi:hypothetical protein
MNKLTLSLFTAALLTGISIAQTSTDIQSSGSASQSTSVSADKSGVRAGSNTSATASQASDVSSKAVQAQDASQLQAGSTVQAELTKPVDARKNKVGDEVVAKTTQDIKSDGKVVLPKGAKIVGKVTQVQARAKGRHESQLGIAFDHAILKDGTQIPVALTIQAVSVSHAAAAAMEEDSMMARNDFSGMGSLTVPISARGGLVGGVASTTGSVVNTAGNTAATTLNAATSAGVNGNLSSTSQGVIGLPGVTLSSAAVNSASAGSTISSNSTNVRLGSGTRMVLLVNGQ